ncbi:MAG: hypothetical protein AB7N80_00430 [Bdellovibrionales bacterium]
MKNWRLHISKKPWLLPTAGTVFALLLATLLQLNSSDSTPTAPSFEIDTYIPQGHVLVPITVHNSENVDSMFGSYGMVDLYPVHETGQVATEAILRGVKMLRAPRNPSQFGVLVPENLAAHVVRAATRFAVVVLNRKSTGTILEKAPHKMDRKIILEGDET